ncbi:MAG: hypothetical protein ACERLM_13765, partial [Acidimicrobiales bacterium]
MNNTRVAAASQRRTTPLLLGASLALAAAFAIGAGTAQAQDADDIDGTWGIDTSIGSFDDYSGTWVGFRVSEVLSPGGDVDAVGRTPVVSGQLEAFGTTIEGAVIEADLTAIISDKPRRDDAIQRALGTNEFPTATFVSTEPVDLGALPRSVDVLLQVVRAHPRGARAPHRRAPPGRKSAWHWLVKCSSQSSRTS